MPPQTRCTIPIPFNWKEGSNLSSGEETPSPSSERLKPPTFREASIAKATFPSLSPAPILSKCAGPKLFWMGNHFRPFCGNTTGAETAPGRTMFVPGGRLDGGGAAPVPDAGGAAVIPLSLSIPTGSARWMTSLPRWRVVARLIPPLITVSSLPAVDSGVAPSGRRAFIGTTSFSTSALTTSCDE